jgi:hypothetical protein
VRGPFFCLRGALSRPSRARSASSRRPCGIDRPAALPAPAGRARARHAPALELEGRPGVSLAGGRRPVVRVTLSAVSTAGARSPWYVVRDPFALVMVRRPWFVIRGARARDPRAVINRRSITCCRRRGPVYVIRWPRSAARGPRSGARGARRRARIRAPCMSFFAPCMLFFPRCPGSKKRPLV